MVLIIQHQHKQVYLTCQVESSLSIFVRQVDITLAVNQQHHQTFELLLVSSPNVAVYWCIAVHVQCIVILYLCQELFKVLCISRSKCSGTPGAG